jgi:hypothetical protein
VSSLYFSQTYTERLTFSLKKTNISEVSWQLAGIDPAGSTIQHSNGEENHVDGMFRINPKRFFSVLYGNRITVVSFMSLSVSDAGEVG